MRATSASRSVSARSAPSGARRWSWAWATVRRFRWRRGCGLSRGCPARWLGGGPFRVGQVCWLVVDRSESGKFVGSSVDRSEDGPSVGSSEPPQASSSNGRSSARAKIPRKSRGVLISIHSLCFLGRGGTVRPNTSTRLGVACLRTRRGEVNDPAGLPVWRPVRLRRCQWLVVPRGSANGKNHPPGGEGLSHSQRTGGNFPSEVTLLPLVGQRLADGARSAPLTTSRRSE